MSSQQVYPYYHPTTCVFLDDNVSFLRGVDLAMDPDLAYQVIDNEHCALRYINADPRLPRLSDRFSGNKTSKEPIPVNNFVEEASIIEQEIGNTERFHQVSVVVVGYSMPNINGIEFCNAIHDPSVGKILLTGAADEAIAVDAFNRGAIDRFVTKSRSNTLDLVAQYIVELEQDYFSTLIGGMQKSLALHAPAYIDEIDFREAFTNLLIEKKCIEYYLVTEPDGFLLLDSKGNLSRMIVVSKESMAEQEDYAARIGAPETILSKLRSRRYIAGPLEDEALVETESSPWDHNLYEARPVGQDSDWYLTLIENPPIDIDFNPTRSSFASYLEALDLIHEEWLARK